MTYKYKYHLALALLFAVSCHSIVYAEPTKPILTSDKVFNLDYGNALFYLNQQKFFSALTQLKIAKTISPIKSQGFTPDILYSALALRYGISAIADNQLKKLLKNKLSKTEHDQVWFYQAKLNISNNQDDLAETALKKIGDSLPKSYILEKNNLLIETLVRLNKLEQAQQELDKTDKDNENYFYSRYNLAVGYIRSGNLESGRTILSELGELESERNDLLALKDKANIALGFSYLKENNAESATEYFTKIRLNGPFSNKGLLGLGWSYVLADKHKKALTPWVELKSRRTIEPAVQEVLLAIPNSLEQLNQLKAAAGQYEEAINSYKREVKKLKATLRLIKSGEFIKSLKPSIINDDSDYPWHLTSLPDTATAAYLGQLFGSRKFQLGFENYRTLLYLNYVVQVWQESLPTYKHVLEIRQSVYNNRLTEVDLQSRVNKLKLLNIKYSSISAKLDKIEKSKNDLALADSYENQLLQRLNTISATLSKDTSIDSEVLREQTNRLRGILTWDIKRDYVSRLWTTKQTLRKVQDSINNTSNKKTTVNNSMSNASGNFSEYNSRFTKAESRLNRINNKLQRSLEFQKQQLNSLATKELNRRHILLRGYIDQAQYSLARLFDELSSDQN